MAQQTCSGAPNLLLLQELSSHALQNTLHIAIHYGNRFIKCDAGDRRSAITSDAGQAPQTFCGFRKLSVVSADVLFRSFLYSASPTLVSQYAPGGKQGIKAGRCQHGNSWKLFKKPPIVIDH